MTVPSLRVTALPLLEIEGDILILGVLKTDAGPALVSPPPGFEALAASLAAIGVSGGIDEVRRVPSPAGVASSVALVGLPAEWTANDLRYAAGSAARQLKGGTTLVFGLPAESPDLLGAVLEGAAIGAYSYDEHRSTKPESVKLPASDIVVASSLGSSDELVSRAAIVAQAMHDVRDLVNAPSSHLYPETLAAAALALGEDAPVQIEVLREEELRAGGFGGILGVGLGSVRGPRLVKVSYSPTEATRHLALVGKGITFDSGGLSLKPPVSMVGMKYDMTGAASVLVATIAAARLGLNVRMTAWLCIAENMPSGSAIRPNDVLRIRGGQTVEVLNTDAEGRLVLADGIVAAGEENPDAIIDVATLTGAQRVALGDRYSGVMGDEDLVAELVAAATTSGELLWPMPLPGELRAMLNSDVADIANAKIGNTAAGMLVAGVFLQEFVPERADDSGTKIPWAHIDIAGPAMNGGAPFGYTAKGPTAVVVRSLLTLAEGISLR